MTTAVGSIFLLMSIVARSRHYNDDAYYLLAAGAFVMFSVLVGEVERVVGRYMRRTCPKHGVRP